jgi:acetyl-CoA carboxylase carboxyl transferase subunit alpha
MKNSTKKPLHLDFEQPIIELESQLNRLSQLVTENGIDATEDIEQLKSRANSLHQEIFSKLSPAQRMQIARHPHRPRTLDYIEAISDEWLELHGDRCSSDNLAIIGGLARISGKKVLMLGHQKGKNTKDNVAHNFGMASPGGYRKAMRLMEHANRFGIPIMTFIDTPGAWAGIEAEHQGQGEAIAYNLREMFRLDVPIICTVIGEGGSGGALGIGIGDRILMLEHAIYTVASPEACAAILWKDAQKAETAATALKITALDLKNQGIIDRVVPEPQTGAHSNFPEAAKILKQELLQNLEELTQLTDRQRRQTRYQKFRQMGVFMQSNVPNNLTRNS